MRNQIRRSSGDVWQSIRKLVIPLQAAGPTLGPATLFGLPGAHGILYSSSMHAHLPAIALFERSAFALPQSPDFHRQLNDPALASVILGTGREIGYTVIDIGRDGLL